MTATDDTTPMIADVDRLIAWMDAEGLGAGESLEHRYISGGSQNEIYELRRGDLHCAMRIPPPSAPADRDDGIVREWRIIQALNGTDVPHTEAIALCTDKRCSVGSSTSWASSTAGRRWAWTAAGRPVRHRPQARRGLAYQLIEGIALLSKVDWRGQGP